MKHPPPSPAFAIGERVAYWPRKKAKDDNEHFEAVVVAYSRNGRPRIEFEGLQIGKARCTVSANSIARQQALPL